MEEQNPGKSNNQLAKAKPQHDLGRRQFLGLLGAGATASAGFSGTVSAQETPIISMGNTYFGPIGLYVEPGTTVQFEIEAGSHSATAYEGRIPPKATPFDSGVISTGRFEYTFDAPGTYDYYCIPHQSMGMVGRIVVGQPGGPAEDNPIPDGAVPESGMIVEQGAITIEEFTESGGDAGGGMMGSGPGMMNEGSPSWMMLMPLGFVTAVLGLAGAVAYWVSRRGNTGLKGDDSAMTILREQYARGQITEEEYMERKRRLQQEGQHSE